MKKSKKILLFMIFLISGSVFLNAEDWVLSCMEFSVSGGRISGTEKISKLLPSLILEQVSTGMMRTISGDEKLDRQLNTLQTERLSLFLQLSNETKKRDALFLSKMTAGEFDSAVNESNKKILEIQEKIDGNIAETEKAAEEFNSSQNNETPAGPFPFFRRRQLPETENVVIYRNDTAALFSPSATALEDGIESFSFAKEVLNAKINGLIKGSVNILGEYISVTAELYVFPGVKRTAAVTEVGSINDLIGIAGRIARNLSPAVANSMPVRLKFAVEPEKAREKAVILVDGKEADISEDFIVDAGIHTVSISAEGFNSETVNYTFTDENFFLIEATLETEKKGSFSIDLKKMTEGIFTFRGTERSEISGENEKASVSVNGKSVLGVFSSGAESAFVYIPENLASDGKNLTVNAKPFDREANIEKRRKSMYLAYSVLICSLPLTYFCVGNSNAAANAYNVDRGTYEDAVSWQNRTYGAVAVTAACGTWFVVELVRYLFAANSVLPATAKAGSK